MQVAIVGASNKPDRYSYKALKSLVQHGHTPIPLHPLLSDIEGVPVVKNLESLPQGIDTITLYVNARVSTELEKKLVQVRPRRIIFNPGTENPELEEKLVKQGIIAQRACTLVLLSTNQF